MNIFKKSSWITIRDSIRSSWDAGEIFAILHLVYGLILFSPFIFIYSIFDSINGGI